MTIDLYTSSGTKKGTLSLPDAVFGADINRGLMHLALVMQQSNRRAPIAHAKHRGEVVGSTKKAYQQKHTGRARRGPIRSPLLRGGGKAFGPRNEANFTRSMPKKMRRAALLSCLSYQAKKGAMIGLESYPDGVKTKDLAALLQKLPLEYGRRTLIITAGPHRGLELSARNLESITTTRAAYVNPEDVLLAKKIVLLSDAVPVIEKTFTGMVDRSSKRMLEDTPEAKSDTSDAPKLEKKPKTKKASSPKKPSTKKSPKSA